MFLVIIMNLTINKNGKIKTQFSQLATYLKNLMTFQNYENFIKGLFDKNLISFQQGKKMMDVVQKKSPRKTIREIHSKNKQPV